VGGCVRQWLWLYEASEAAQGGEGVNSLSPTQHAERLVYVGEQLRLAREFRDLAVVAAHEAGMSYRRIGLLVGLSRETVRLLCERAAGGPS